MGKFHRRGESLGRAGRGEGRATIRGLPHRLGELLRETLVMNSNARSLHWPDEQEIVKTRANYVINPTPDQALRSTRAVRIAAYAVMSNHVHLVIQTDPGHVQTWTDDEVLERWRRVMRVQNPLVQQGNGWVSPQPTVSPERIAIWRQRLGSLSWFMAKPLETITRRANREDDCTGRFWESWFHCQALLDDTGLCAAMADVDLNPV